MLRHVDRIITEARASLAGGGKGAIFVNLRDACQAWLDPDGYRGRRRLLEVAQHLSQKPAAERISGFLVEESTGDMFPWDMTECISTLRKVRLPKRLPFEIFGVL